MTKIRAAGGGSFGIPLSEDACSYLLAVVVRDLGLDAHFPDLPSTLPPFFGTPDLSSLVLPNFSYVDLFQRIIALKEDADTYFYCLATLHKARLKNERVFQAQAVPTIDQVGPRGLLQYGTLTPKALVGFLFWRKWIFDIDNRAAQGTGYLFEPIISHAIGGVPYGHSKSPVRRADNGKGRQVDCLVEDSKEAYEIKLRVTIAASGQGRWEKELEFPIDCANSGYKPRLLVLDPTENPKLLALVKAFKAAKDGDAFVGDAAWAHLKEKGGPTMAIFIEKYVVEPIKALSAEVSPESPTELPDIKLSMTTEELRIDVGGEILIVKRSQQTIQSDDDELPQDVDEHIPNP
jgi:hypothetical protein